MEFLSKLSKKEKIGLYLAVIVVLLAFLDQIVVKPIRNKVARLNQKIQICEEELKRDLQSLSEKKSISREYEKYARYVTKAGSDEEEVAKILAEIEELARKSTVNLVDITPQTPGEFDFYREYTAEIEIEGKTGAVVKFLYELNNSALLLRTQKVRLTLRSRKLLNITAVILVTKILIF